MKDGDSISVRNMLAAVATTDLLVNIIEKDIKKWKIDKSKENMTSICSTAILLQMKLMQKEKSSDPIDGMIKLTKEIKEDIEARDVGNKIIKGTN